MRRKIQIGLIFVITAALMIACFGIAFADSGVYAAPEVQGLATGTSVNAQGTVTETDSGAWTLTNDPDTVYIATAGSHNFLLKAADVQQIEAAGGSAIPTNPPSGEGLYLFWYTTLIVPQSLMDQPLIGGGGETWGDLLTGGAEDGSWNLQVSSNPGIHTGVLDPGQVQYTAGYNDQYSGISGQQTFGKTAALSTANTIADQSNIKANTNIQFIAIDTGRATRTEDLLLDGASQAQDSSSLILCPFANDNSGIIPAFCNIEQSGSAFDTTLTSTVTSADTRFIGSDATIPTVLNYNINSEGLTTGNQSSPMIGSVSAYIKVHEQEARNESTASGVITIGGFGPPREIPYSVPDSLNPVKSEDLVYSESSSASGLISGFSKSMSYVSQASSVAAPQVIPLEF
ncbi:MAG TPA: hypothetical protein VMC42_06770 [Methanoregulaceae archaeon]|nr:hypothetical protein [Methanoregulaceae archaeon]